MYVVLDIYAMCEMPIIRYLQKQIAEFFNKLVSDMVEKEGGQRLGEPPVVNTLV